jgi:hypothetical protein
MSAQEGLEGMPVIQRPGARTPGDSEAGGTHSPVVSGVVAGAIALVGWIGTDSTSGWLRIVLGLVTVIALAYAVYTLGLVVCFLAVKQVIDQRAGGSLSGPQKLLVWILIPIVTITWALWAWLAGFDASQWARTGASLGAGTLILLMVLRPSR